jgi:phage shock protein PspC (stress-responsive transcriptional regulator)
MINRYGLYRDPTHGWIAGVASGLGQRFGVSTGVIRLVFVVFALLAHPMTALVVYALLALLMPARSYMIETAADRRRWRNY